MIKDSLIVYVLSTIFGILAGRCGSVVVRERDEDTKAPDSRSRFDPGRDLDSF